MRARTVAGAGPSAAALPADEVAAARSRKSSFYLAMRILPKPQREAMFEIYSFCRAVDDIADEPGPLPARRAALARWRRDVDALYGLASGDPPKGLVAATKRFGLARLDFQALIDGMEMDLDGPIRAPDAATLDLYCDRVASAVGRLSVKVFGAPAQEGEALAHHLGRALQLANILRDLDEDAGVGRLYLPREALEAAGIDPDAPPQIILDHPALGAACAPLLAQARAHFDEARAIMARCPRASVKAPAVMADVYEPMLAQMERNGFAPPRARPKTSKLRALFALARRSFA
ncbi:presqualene diphosphate synthase HpnD [Methylocella sp.]|uniref:presqualene diphosphate synthase HpnD n=1 Tax=Methylocella sp. TaxID=1978226 RepID=UPI003783B701